MRQKRVHTSPAAACALHGKWSALRRLPCAHRVYGAASSKKALMKWYLQQDKAHKAWLAHIDPHSPLRERR